MTKEKLNKQMDNKWAKLIKKYPIYNADWLYEMHKLLDWYENKFKNIKK